MFTEKQYKLLLENGRLHPNNHNAIPCVYLLGEHNAFLLSEICNDNNNLVYGLYYDDDHNVTKGTIELSKLYEIHQNFEFLFNDRTFHTEYTIDIFHLVAKEVGSIIPDEKQFIDLFDKYNI